VKSKHPEFHRSFSKSPKKRTHTNNRLWTC